MQYRDPITGIVINIPDQGPGDKITRQDEIMASILAGQMVNTAAVRELIAAVKSSSPSGAGGFNPTRQELETGAVVPYSVWPEYSYRSLGTAATDLEVQLTGNSIACWTDGNPASIGVRLNTRTAPIIFFSELNPIGPLPFYKIYLTYTAQAGKSLRLYTSRNGAALAPPMGKVGHNFFVVKTDPTVLFTGALAQGAATVTSSLGLFNCSQMIIRSIQMVCEQNIFYRFIIGSVTTGFVASEAPEAFVDFDLPTCGTLMAGTLYEMTLEGLDIYCAASGGYLTAGLFNNCATSKIAGAGGKVVIRIVYEPLDSDPGNLDKISVGS